MYIFIHAFPYISKYIKFIKTIIIIFMSVSSNHELPAIYNPATHSFKYHDIICEVSTFLLSNTVAETAATAETSAAAANAMFWFNVFMVFILTFFAGLMSGLTVGYLSIDDLVMELKLTTGTPEEKHLAGNILPVIRHHHWLLVTLLLCNAFAFEAMPIFLARLVNEMLAIVISVTLILFFGEIIPQALCTGPNQLKIASFLAKPTKCLMYLTYPISYPLSILVDHVVGLHMKSRFANSDLRGLIELHTKEALKKIEEEEEGVVFGEDVGLTQAQANAMLGALDIEEKKAKDIMIPLDRVTMLDYNAQIDEQSLNIILQKGFSRIPVYSGRRSNVIGILRIKHLINMNVCDGCSLKDKNIQLSQPIVVSPEMFAVDLLNQFIEGKSHMAFITKEVTQMQRKLGLNEENSYHESLLVSNLNKQGNSEQNVQMNLLGIVTLEDVIENLIRIKILDEDDYKRNKAQRSKQSKQREKIKQKLTKKVCESFINENKAQIHSLINSGGFDKANNLIPNDDYVLLDNKIT